MLWAGMLRRRFRRPGRACELEEMWFPVDGRALEEAPYFGVASDDEGHQDNYHCGVFGLVGRVGLRVFFFAAAFFTLTKLVTNCIVILLAVGR